MRVLVAPDKFKGSLTAPEVASRVAAGLRAAVPDVAVVEVPVADGGEGTVQAAVSAGYRLVPVRADGPTDGQVETAYAEKDGVAVVELADVSGLGRLTDGQFAPLHATTYGTGEVVRAALDAGSHRIVLGIGGSASTDGGAGLVQALGVRLLDDAGRELPRGGAALAGLERVDASGLHPRVRDVDFLVACDVDNPLLGQTGAAAVYGPQKGASGADVAALEAALARWAEIAGRDLGADAASAAGAGAAGGVGYAALVVLHAVLRLGAPLILDLVGFAAYLPGTDLVITGEGSMDRQSLHGKAPVGVAAAAREAGIPVVAVTGRCLLSEDELAAAGIGRVYALADLEPDPAVSIANAGPLLEELAGQLARRELNELKE